MQKRKMQKDPNTNPHPADGQTSLGTPLQQSEDRFRVLVEGIRDYAFFMLDVDGRVTTWNLGAERIKGYKASEIIGKHFSCFYSEQEILSGKPQLMLDVAIRDGQFEEEGWRLRKDGSRFWANIVITALRNDSGKLIGFRKVTRDITEKMQIYEALRKANEELGKEIVEKKEAQRKLQESERSLRLLSGHLLRTQDEERRRIGRDLHDTIGQWLAVLKMKLDSLQSTIAPPGNQFSQSIGECSSMAEECMKEVRTLSYLLYPPMLEELGLKSAIPWCLEGFTHRSGIKTTFEISSGLPRLSRDVELAIFRVLQESLTNVHRHSGSPHAHIRVMMGDGLVSLEVIDDGKGIPREVLAESTKEDIGALGVGLRGMTERVRQLGGRLELSSNENGTTLRAMIPCVESATTEDVLESRATPQIQPPRKAGMRA
jgi:PAS domain S-box-containing protein